MQTAFTMLTVKNGAQHSRNTASTSDSHSESMEIMENKSVPKIATNYALNLVFKLQSAFW